MSKNILLSVFLLTSFTLPCLNAQNDDLGLELNAYFGVAFVSNQIDPYRETYAVNGSTFLESKGARSAYFDNWSFNSHISLVKPLSPRWKGGLFVEFLFDNAELLSDINALGLGSASVANHSFSYRRKFRWLNLGTAIYYKIKKGNRYNIWVSTGLIAVITKHRYRSDLTLDYTNDFQVENIEEVFTTEYRKMIGIPVYFEYDYSINNQLSLAFSAHIQSYFQGYYSQISWLGGVKYHLE